MSWIEIGLAHRPGDEGLTRLKSDILATLVEENDESAEQGRPFWQAEHRGFSMSSTVFRKVAFFGGEIQAINAVDVSFVNTKFRGVEIDTTNFSKVRFITEEPKVEGNAVITPEYTLIENSVLKSERKPPQAGVLDLTDR